MTYGFIESVRFPDSLAYWMEGGRGFQTTVVRTFSGNEYRNADWSQALAPYTIRGEGLRAINSSSTEYYVPLRNLFMVSYGRLGGFRFKDFRDYQDEGGGVLGTTGLAVAATLAYQMWKNYAISPNSYQQKVLKPVASTVRVYNNGVLQVLTTDYTLSSTTGVVTFVSQPTVGHTLTFTGEHDIPVRFTADTPTMGPDSSGAFYDWSGLGLIELRNP